MDAQASSHESKLTRDGSAEVADEEETSSLELRSREYANTGWTNEKHSLYLKSMETSFVNQLHDSMGFLSWRLRNRFWRITDSSRAVCRDTYSPSRKLDVTRRNHLRQRINFAEPRLNQFHMDSAYCIQQGELAGDAKKEVSDQNFADEESNAEKATRQSNPRNPKSQKIGGSTINHQVIRTSAEDDNNKF